VYRIERTGAFVRGPASQPTSLERPLHAITFVEDFWPVPPDRSFALADYLAAYTEVLDSTHVRMRFEPYLQRHERFEQLFAEQFPLQEQGCILVNVAPPDLMNWLTERKVPFVVQYYYDYRRDGLPPHHGVCVNKFRGAFEAVQYLLSLGHSHIGFTGAPDDLAGVAAGYEAAMRWAGITPSAGDTLPVATDNVDVAYPHALEFLKRNRELTAVFAQADAMAVALLRAAKTLGIRVPEELSVVGFNDQEEAARSDPPLTTVAAPRRLLARTAVGILLKVVNGDYPTWEQRVLDCHLVVRKSAAPPAKEGGDGQKQNKTE